VTKIIWDDPSARRFENGVNKGVLYIPNDEGVYDTGVGWNGLTKISEKPTGATATAQYADNIKYLNLTSTEQFAADISAFTYPDEWGQCDGTQEPEPGVAIGQQNRKSFGLSYQTKVGTALNPSLGYKIHLVYGATAAPSQKDYATINDSPAAIELTWSMTTTPVNVTGYAPTATLEIDSTKVDATALGALEDILYGTVGENPSLPTPDAVLALFSGTVTVVTPVAPTYTSGTHTITIPTVTGLTYFIAGEAVTGSVVITGNTVVTAQLNAGYRFADETVNEWEIVF
jgi:hypothetical protein